MKVSVSVFVLVCLMALTACSSPRKVGKTILDPLPAIENDNRTPDDIMNVEGSGEPETNTILESIGDLNPVFFDYDKAQIRSDQIEVLQANAQYLRAASLQKIQIQGHCDERGTEEYNLALGDRRAHAVKEYLSALGIAQERLSTISYGEAMPFEKKHDETAWSKNRRAQFLEEHR